MITFILAATIAVAGGAFLVFALRDLFRQTARTSGTDAESETAATGAGATQVVDSPAPESGWTALDDLQLERFLQQQGRR